MEFYIDSRVSAQGTCKLLKEEKKKAKTKIHGLLLYQGDTVLTKLSFDPYSLDEPRQVYSVSKTFTSTAIGIACDLGLLHVTDKVLKFFPEKAPQNPDIFLQELSVEHLLTMTAGHGEDSMPAVVHAADGVAAFLAKKIVKKPGSEYLYDTGASYMLSAILSKVTGRTLLDFLKIHLFLPLGIENVYWPCVGGDYNEGGAGLRICANALVKVGLMYLNRGVYNGKRILSEEWIEKAIDYHSTGSLGREPDWASGYGYQIWRNARGGYRADGAFGQYFIVLPKFNRMLVVFCESLDVEHQLPLLLDYMENCFAEDVQREKAIAEIKTMLVNSYPPVGNADSAPNGMSELYTLEENCYGYSLLQCRIDETGICLGISDGEQLQKIQASCGKWQRNVAYLKKFLPQLYSLVPENRIEKCDFLASYIQKEKGVYELLLRFMNCAHTAVLTLKFDQNSVLLTESGETDAFPTVRFMIKGKKV